MSLKSRKIKQVDFSGSAEVRNQRTCKKETPTEYPCDTICELIHRRKNNNIHSLNLKSLNQFSLKHRERNS